jgi:putative hydrolase of the HAD superfamily
LRALIFDAGNTLLRMDYGAIASHLGARGLRASAASVEEAELRARVSLDAHLGPRRSTESGVVARWYLRYLLEHLGLHDESLVEDISRWRSEGHPRGGLWRQADPEARAALEAARGAGLVVGVISNSDGSVRALLDGAGLGAHLDFVIDSAEVGVEKPDPRIFRLGLERARAEPAEVAYVGDLYSVDVLGARGAGIEGVLLDPRGYWGARDCPLARGVLDAVRRLLATPAGG